MMPMDPRQAAVWAAFGWVTSLGQLIEDHIRTILAAGPEQLTATPAEFEERMNKMLSSKHTLGPLIANLKAMGADEALHRDLDDVLDCRNRLAHSFLKM